MKDLQRQRRAPFLSVLAALSAALWAVAGCTDQAVEAPPRFACFRTIDPYAGAGAWHRGNFHMHSRHSDGAEPGDKLVQLYLAQGYSVLCLSDHNEYGDQDGGVLPSLQGDSLPHDWNNDGIAQPLHVYGSGTEAYVRDWSKPGPPWSLDQWVRDASMDWSAMPVLLPGAEFTNNGLHVGLVGYPGGGIEPPSQKTVRVLPAAQRTRLAGGFVFLAHPAEWTPQNLEKELDLGLLDGIEVANGLRLTQSVQSEPNKPGAVDAGCSASLPWDATPLWDGLLARGHRLWGLANDDSHTWVGAATAYPFTAFDMIRTDDPTATGFMKALHAGSFYASTGLVFAEIGVRDGTIVALAPEATQIRFIGWGGRVLAHADAGRGEYRPRGDEGYVRVEVSGTPTTTKWAPMAWSQPFWIENAPCGGATSPPHPSPK